MTQAQITARRRLEEILSDNVSLSSRLDQETIRKLRALRWEARIETHEFCLGDQVTIEACYEIVFREWLGR